ncbi:DUF3169 family protein [Clostridium grantii]|uniref:DUF3169 domain-containing protein n=1 Tax=Clostridium grantii DSM 8605 TaxID=1121316 RepID=A0A1M5W2B7_9CLOT|nr:DUF3169 family protein [Clostridium grantii]SHH81570.1 Protein of unknown function [Clostridium grantii DSM 8605]
MNKAKKVYNKTAFRLLLLLIIGGILGGISSIGMIKFKDSEYVNLFTNMGKLFIENSININIALIVFLFLPAVYFNIKGRKITNMMFQENVSDDKIESFEKYGSKFRDISLSINSVFIILNFMLLGMTFDVTNSKLFVTLIVFLVSCIAGSVLEIVTIKFMQKNDSRLKGDPTSFKFHKDFLESCDEAEKLKIYKTGYKAFQFSRGASLVLIIITIMGNMTFKTGGFPVFISGMFMLIQISSYSYYDFKENN